jgi:hypothetical protein
MNITNMEGKRSLDDIFDEEQEEEIQKSKYVKVEKQEESEAEPNIMDLITEPSWKTVLDQDYKSKHIANLTKFLNEEYEKNIIYPPKNKIFNALNTTPFNKVKVVILGQDCYFNPGTLLLSKFGFDI